ncbi:hypothetical protein L0U95_22565 (plasmid) [Burkholderia cenocepacia]|nr:MULTISPECIES: hypothetical protein [Burkholderia cepacia complex]UJH77465.1 hypothetical protein L0U95_22565 [Burkholderia cenocepacia]
MTYYRAPLDTDRLGFNYDLHGNIAFDDIDDDIVRRRPLAYLCGSASFLDVVTRGLVGRGIPAFDVFAETFQSEVQVPPDLTPQDVTLAQTGQTFTWSPAVVPSWTPPMRRAFRFPADAGSGNARAAWCASSKALCFICCRMTVRLTRV